MRRPTSVAEESLRTLVHLDGQQYLASRFPHVTSPHSDCGSQINGEGMASPAKALGTRVCTVNRCVVDHCTADHCAVDRAAIPTRAVASRLRLSSANKCDESGLHQPLVSCASNRVPLPAPRPSLMPSTIPCERKGQELLGTALR